MDPEYAALASAAATAVVTAMAKEGWEGIKSAFAGLWRREPPQRVASIEAALDDSRQELLNVAEPLVRSTEAELIAEWQARLRRLLTANPDVARELTDVLGLERQHAGEVRFGSVSHQGIGDVNQAGRDIAITRASGRPRD
jgi:hypothetical protein